MGGFLLALLNSAVFLPASSWTYLMTNPSAATFTNFKALNKPELITKCEEFEAQMNQPAPQLSPMERRKQCASNTTVGIINRVLPITRKDGSAVEGGYKFWLTQSIEINYGTIESPDYQRIEVQSSPFTAWDNGTPENPNPVGTELFNLMKENDYAVVRLFWEFDGQGKGNVCLKDVTNTDEDGNIEPVLNALGEPLQKKGFNYAPKKKVFAFDNLKAAKNQPKATEEIPF